MKHRLFGGDANLDTFVGVVGVGGEEYAVCTAREFKARDDGILHLDAIFQKLVDRGV